MCVAAVGSTEMGFSVDDTMYRVDKFKASGKWYMTYAVRGRNYNEPDIFDAVRNDIMEAGISLDRGEMFVILEPYHKNAHPLMFKAAP